MAGLEYDEDFLCEEELVQELLKFNIYASGKQDKTFTCPS
jgi:hypothetical protein